MVSWRGFLRHKSYEGDPENLQKILEVDPIPNPRVAQLGDCKVGQHRKLYVVKLSILYVTRHN